MAYTYEQIKEAHKKLPKDLQDALYDVKITDIERAIGKRHGLMLDKIGKLIEETGLVMLGLTRPEDYIKNLAKRLEAPPEKAKAIADDINQQVFKPIRESLKKIHNVSTPAQPPKIETKPPPEKAKEEKQPDIFVKPLPKEEPIPPPNLPVEEVPPQAPPSKASLPDGQGEESKEALPLLTKEGPGEVKDDHEDFKSKLEKELGGEIRTTAPKHYDGQDPYKEPIE